MNEIEKEGTGKIYMDKLIHEVVTLGEDTISISYFEVTNAQF